MENSWFKNAIFYSLDVETFYDSNGDGIGDFPGLINKLDYIASLGVNCIWLLPFYPSPNRDNGYDVTDYYNVDSRLGSLGDFAEFMYKAESHGIRVLIDLVVNHTSIEHPWFKEAKKDRDSPYRQFYVWSDEPQEYSKDELMLSGEEETMWTYDEEAKQYYLHRFYKEQPDLNITNAKVREEILRIIGFWLQLGVAGFRIDAAEMLIETYGVKEAVLHDLSHFLEELRQFISLKKSDAVLLAEVNTVPEEMEKFLQNGTRMHMLFNFYMNQYLFLALAKQKTAPLINALQTLPLLDTSNQWLNFLRHHDELSLSLLTKDEQQEVFKEFAPNEEMRIYGRGIRRRITSILNGDIDKIKLAFSLMFSLPGVPLIRYGDEISMGDDLSLHGRASVRTPMQWSNQINGGFSNAPADKLVHPVIDDEEYGYQRKNVIYSQQDDTSFLNWLERLISTRKQCCEIGTGRLKVLEAGNRKILLHYYNRDEDEMVFIHNLSEEVVEVDVAGVIELNGKKFFTLLAETKRDEIDLFVLQPFGFRWYRLNR